MSIVIHNSVAHHDKDIEYFIQSNEKKYQHFHILPHDYQEGHARNIAL